MLDSDHLTVLQYVQQKQKTRSSDGNLTRVLLTPTGKPAEPLVEGVPATALSIIMDG